MSILQGTFNTVRVGQSPKGGDIIISSVKGGGPTIRGADIAG